MRQPWTWQVASDVIRDGLGLELLDGAGEVAAEVFRCDADHTVTVQLFKASIPDDLLAELIGLSRTELEAFEDGMPLPPVFRIEHVVQSRYCSQPAPDVPFDGLGYIRTILPSDRIARVLVCLDAGELVALHAFIKQTQQTQQTPVDELGIARERHQESTP